MKIQDIYSDPTDSIPTLATEDHFYESLEDLQKSHGSLHNLLGSANQKPPMAPTPALLKKRQPLAERSNLPPIKKECSQKVSKQEPNLSSNSKKKGFEFDEKSVEFDGKSIEFLLINRPAQKSTHRQCFASSLLALATEAAVLSAVRSLALGLGKKRDRMLGWRLRHCRELQAGQQAWRLVPDPPLDVEDACQQGSAALVGG